MSEISALRKGAPEDPLSLPLCEDTAVRWPSRSQVPERGGSIPVVHKPLVYSALLCGLK